MITASGSIRFTADATPAPRASIARSIRWTASLSLVLDRPLPDPAGEPVPAALLHDLEQLRLRPLLLLLTGLQLHRRPAGIGLHAAPAPAGALGPVDLDDHVADLRRGAPPEPGLPLEDQAAADPGSPPDAEDRLVVTAGAEVELALDRDLDVVAELDLRPQVFAERSRRAGTCPPSRAGSSRPRRSRSSRRRRRAIRRRPRPAPRSRRRPARPLRAGPPRSRRRRPAGRPRSGSGRRASPRTLLSASTTTAWILVPPRSMPPRGEPSDELMAGRYAAPRRARRPAYAAADERPCRLARVVEEAAPL